MSTASAAYKQLMEQLTAKREEEQALYAAINKAREAHETLVKQTVADLTEIVKDGLSQLDADMIADLKPLTIVVGADDAIVVRVGSVVAPRARAAGNYPASRQITYEGRTFPNAMALVTELGLPQPASKFSAVRLLKQHNIVFTQAA